jgi:hypothetical protein
LRRALVIVLTVLALAPSVVRASIWYRSQDGVLRDSCCCPARAGYHRRSAPERAVRSACCCAIVERAARDGAVRAAPPARAEISPVAAAVTPVPPPATAELAGLDRPPMTRGPPALPDLFVHHCALLL